VASPNPQPQITWRARIVSLRNIRGLLKLIWETDPFLAIASMLLRLCRAVLPLGALWVPKLILDGVVAVIAHQDVSKTRLWKLVALEFAIAISNDLIVRLNTLCESLLADRFTNLVSVRLITHAATLDLASFEDPVFCDKLQRARTQTSARLSLFTALLILGQDAITLISLSAGLIVFSPWLIALLIVAVIPSFIGETHLTALAYSVLYRSTPERRALEYFQTLGASPQPAKEIKLFGLGDHLAQEYQRVSQDIYAANKKVAAKRATLSGVLNTISTMGYYGAYAVIMLKTLAGMISLGTFSFLTGAFARSRGCIERLSSSASDISEQALYLNDLFQFFEERPAIRSAPNALPAPRPIRQGFEFRNVSFAYPGADRLVLSKVSFRLRPGERLALIGENGAGKTTIVKLLARLYDPTAGQILLDGIDLREYGLADLHRQMSVVFQDYVRFELPVRENIGFGDLQWLKDEARLKQAARKSGAAEFIDRLPDGYNQMLGRRFENGVGLSGGEWQKLALARAYFRDAQLLIFDEPTASLDARAEHEAFQRFTMLTQDRMAILISHRFSTVRMADQILVLANGEIQEQGAHHELLELEGRYAELFGLQAAGYR
jgi:ATP-binding cassette subfamily B protein